MTRRLSLSLLAAGLLCAPDTRSHPSFPLYGAVDTLRRDGTVEVRVRSLDGWGISTAYWASVTMGTQSLSLGEAAFYNPSADGSAVGEVVWYVESEEDSGSVRVVFCRPGERTRPVDGEFTVD